jgi:hypothetical protein
LSWNRYAYAKGNPIGRFDPRGLEDCDPDDPDEGCEDPCDDNPWDPECQQGGGGGPGPQQPKKTKKQPANPCNNTNVINFINANGAAANAIASATGIPALFTLALSAGEVGFSPTNPVDTQNNNYFDLRLAPGANAATATSGWQGAGPCSSVGGSNYSTGWACFASANAFYTSGLSAYQSNGGVYGTAVLSVLNSDGGTYTMAAQAVSNAGFDPGNTNYGTQFQGALDALNSRLGCPGVTVTVH